jgi:transposase InsO family protein
MSKQFTTTDRIKIVEYFLTEGILATTKAITLQGKKLSRATLYRWVHRYKESIHINNGLHLYSDLQGKSTRPHTMRTKDLWDERIVKLIQDYRTLHPRISKEKCHIYLQTVQKELVTLSQLDSHIKLLPQLPSITTIGRIIQVLTINKSIPYRKGVYLDGACCMVKPYNRTKPKKTRRKEYTPDNPGDLVQCDTVEIRWKNKKRYIRTGIDILTRIPHAKAYKNHISANTVDFLKNYTDYTKITINRVQTDNGSEFAGDATSYITKQGMVHYHNYPASPKQNAFIERFNRTIQEEFINHHLDLLFTNLDVFNSKLIDYLTWYIYDRPHFGLQLRTPYSVLLDYRRKSHLW